MVFRGAALDKCRLKHLLVSRDVSLSTVLAVESARYRCRVQRSAWITWSVILGAVVVGIVTDTANWPIDNWPMVEVLYAFAVTAVIGTVDDVRRWRRNSR